VNQVRRCRAGHDGKVGRRPRHGIDVERMPFGPDAVDADRHRHRPRYRCRLHGRSSRLVLVLGLHRIFEVEHDEIGPSLTRLGDRAWVRGGQEQNRPHGE
jgi:hypothetical protein